MGVEGHVVDGADVVGRALHGGSQMDQLGADRRISCEMSVAAANEVG